MCGTFRAVQAGLHVKSNSECIIDLLSTSKLQVTITWAWLGTRLRYKHAGPLDWQS